MKHDRKNGIGCEHRIQFCPCLMQPRRFCSSQITGSLPTFHLLYTNTSCMKVFTPRRCGIEGATPQTMSSLCRLSNM